MPRRHLSPEEVALWRRVTATVRPLAPEQAVPAPVAVPALPAPAARPPHREPPPPRSRSGPGTTLDAGWDRRLARGLISPDATIDLHGHTLDTAYAALDHAVDRAILRGDRVLLVITGRPPRPESERPHARGRIRAALPDWLAASRHAARIAAIRPAHQRHGGAGAVYLVLRRPR